KYLNEHQEEYGWAEQSGLALMSGTDPGNIMPEAKSIIVLLEAYFQQAFPKSLESHFGRCYLDDDRVTKEGLAKRFKAFRDFLKKGGINSKVPFNIPHRMAAARAGLGTFGKNGLLYAERIARRSSWVISLPILVDREFAPDEPTMRMGCPEWCRSACIAACPTKALKGNGALDPRRCVSFLTYFGSELTPRELREPMGMYVYGCDRCQNVCPRNLPALGEELPMNVRAAAKVGDFGLTALLHMDRAFFESRIWPHMFYMSPDNLWKWKMNVARAMGNSRDERYIADLVRAFDESGDERTRGMIAWALGKIGGSEAGRALEKFRESSSGIVREEIEVALE
ncbi:MAG: 4Fe-4S double cluster binding domain-containing protein, partial [Syntrophales bacterium]|nr:4Fe-4S double cluster binding domain-containing protein [Syntrophales bacterium]